MNDPTFTFANIGLPLLIIGAVAAVLPWVMVPRDTRSQRRVAGVVVATALFMVVFSAMIFSVFDKRSFLGGETLPGQGVLAWMYVRASLGAVVAWGPVLLFVWLGLAQRVERLKGEDMVRENK
ncbi:MAG: hypothetical protein AAFW87_05745 [Pseudomonadota bacterium]